MFHLIRTVEKVSRFNLLAQADDSHSKTLRSKILSPGAASQKAVLSAPPVHAVPAAVSTQGPSAYEERMLAMERRLQQLAEENLALQRDLQAAVNKQATTTTVAHTPAVEPVSAPVPGTEDESVEEHLLTASDVTVTESSAATLGTLGSVPRHPHQPTDSAARSPAPSPPS
mgnify:FL=1